MVEPSSLADTVTPSSFWPDRAAIAPLSTGSAARTEVAARSDAAQANSTVLVVFSGLEVVLERGHAVGSVDDERARDVVVPGGRGLVQRRPVGLDSERGLQVADAAGLRDNLAAEELCCVEIVLLCIGGWRGRGEREYECRDSLFHSVPPLVSVTIPPAAENFNPQLSIVSTPPPRCAKSKKRRPGRGPRRARRRRCSRGPSESRCPAPMLCRQGWIAASVRRTFRPGPGLRPRRRPIRSSS